MTRVLVCGGHRFNNRDAMMRALRPHENKDPTEPSPHKIIVGGALGADAIAEEWARCFQVSFRIFPADWNKHGRHGAPRAQGRGASLGGASVTAAVCGELSPGRSTLDHLRAEE